MTARRFAHKEVIRGNYKYIREEIKVKEKVLY
jgi:hypothetical protein